MRGIKELLQAEKNGEKLTDKEQKYLEQYKQQKNVRHSQNFVTHATHVPKEIRREQID